MDYYLSSQTQINGPDSLSLQEMLDMDIKSENDFESVFTCGDFNLNFQELPALNLDEDSLGAPGDNNVWLTSSSDSQSLLGGDINSSLSLDMTSGETRMVCPNSVMPVTLIQIPYQPSNENEVQKDKLKKNEDKLNKSTMSSKQNSLLNNNAVNRKIKQEVKEEPSEDFYEPEDILYNENDYLAAGIKFTSDEIKTDPDDDSFHLSTKFGQNGKGKVKVQGGSNVRSSPLTNRNSSNSVNSISSSTPLTNSTKRPVNNVRSINSKKRLNDQFSNSDDLIIVYPKPAYSYSCLIAMALKNSPSGSLPVSEIYNFMCEHFPYFKTAPSGWKNSVRHNLSLNKCFEKIEKPATNGSQRKGCLWAMNPNKIGKMDEEVQKWSKKDKLGIKKSMIYPESLDALERGELSGNYNHNPGSIETIHSEIESEEEQGEPDTNGDWTFKQEDSSEEEEEEEEEDDEEESVENRLNAVNNTSRLSAEQVKSVFTNNDEFEESDLSLSDFDIEVAEAIYNDVDSDKLKFRLNSASPTSNPFQTLSGIGLSAGATYTFNPQSNSENSPKRIKTLGGSTISGNYVYKPIGTTSSRRKSPLRPTVLSSLEADD